MNRKLVLQVFAFVATFLSVFAIISSVVQSVPPIPEQTLIVDISGNGDYTSIQDAIDNATGGQTILVKKGVYLESNLNVDKRIRIMGEDPATTIINCSDQLGITISSSSVDISNLKITYAKKYSIYVEQGSTKCNISNVVIEKITATGILVRASDTKIYRCDIKGLNNDYGTGIQLQESNSIITDCNIQGVTSGVLILINSDGHSILNCNLFNNKKGVDIRIDSNRNLVSDCNIYANDVGVKIWQNSINNSVYLNNFWRNVVDASAEGGNVWDNGELGNYWSGYTGSDSDDDGIGDTPYTISENNVDRFPLSSMIMPDEITMPTGLITTSSSSDDTPAFTWNPSLYNNGIKGYYVKIDSNPEVFIGDTTTWTSTDSVMDGVHTFYVRAETMDDTSSDYASVTFLIDTTFIDMDGDGWSDGEEQLYGTDPEDGDNYPLDTDGDRVPDSLDSDDDNDGYSDSLESSYGTSTKNSNSYPLDTDEDDLPDEDSPDGEYKGDVDDDDDYLVDTIETSLGSNPKDGSDAEKIYVAGEPYFLVDVSGDGVYDILYNPESGETTAVEKQYYKYLVDVNGDGGWDYIYNTNDGSVSPYKGLLVLPLPVWIILILAFVITALIVSLYIVWRKRYKVSGRPEGVVKRLPFLKPSKIHRKDRDAIERISDTKELLKYIQEDVVRYLKKLEELEDQIKYTSLEREQEEVVPEEETIDLEDIDEIEVEVDKLLAKLEKKDED